MKLTKTEMSRNIVERNRMLEADARVPHVELTDPDVVRLARNPYDFLVEKAEQAVDDILGMMNKFEARARETRILQKRLDLGLEPGDKEPTLEELARELKKARAGEIEDDRTRFDETESLRQALAQAVADLRSTEDELQDARELLEKQEAANWEARNTIRNARDEAEEKAIDSLSRYKFQMFGYWAACWVHANRQAKECGLGAEPSPFWAFVQLAQKIDAKVASGRKPAGGVS